MSEEFCVKLTPPMPVTLGTACHSTVGTGCREQSYEASYKQEDDMTVVWAKRQVPA